MARLWEDAFLQGHYLPEPVLLEGQAVAHNMPLSTAKD